MTLPPEVIKAILEAGGSIEVVVAACEAAAKSQKRSQERTRAEWRERQQRRRSSKDQSAERVLASKAPANVTNVTNVTDVTVTPVTSTPPSFSPPTPTPITTPPAAAAAAREAAWALADQIAVICGLDLDFLPPQWISAGPGERVKIWLANGWQREIILAVVRQLVGRNPKRPVRSIRFFEAAIAQAHSQIAEPLPPTQEQAHAQTGQRELAILHPVGGGRRVAPDWQASRDAWRAARAELEASAAGLGDGDPGDSEALPPASAARRERS